VCLQAVQKPWLHVSISQPRTISQSDVKRWLSQGLVWLCYCRMQWTVEGSVFGAVTTTILQPFFRDHPGEPVPEENFWTLWCKGTLTEAADTLTIRLSTTPSGLTSAHLHHLRHFLQAGCPSCHPTKSIKALKAIFGTVSLWLFLFVWNISGTVERISPNSHVRRVWSLAWTRLKVKVTRDKKASFFCPLAACVQFMFF